MLKPIIRMLAFATCIFYPGLANGGILTAEEAKEVATDFFQNADVSRLADVGSLELAYVEKVDTTPRYYIFNATDKKGFIIVSADDTALPVMAYSTTSAWLPQAMPEAAERLLETPASVLKSSSRRSPGRVSRSGRKLLNTPTWSQEAPFNSKIPNRPLVGCVGTALAEILKYHQYPVNRPSSLVKEGETATYDWSNMRNDNYRNGYNAVEGDAVGTLVADAAIAIGTDFGMSSSSAFEVKVPSALITMFGYDAGVSYKKGSEMDRDSWDALIVNEIDENRPVLYCGQDVSAGHAFVCDGYEMMGPTVYLHINWGWAGGADGFYASDALNPTMSKTYNFNNLTTVVYNIKPATSSAEWSPIHLTSDENQVGMTMDVTDIQPGTTFKVRAGALKNISNNNFSGSISLGLFSADGTFKRLLCDGKNFGLSSLNILKYTDISCTVPADAVIEDDDVIRLVTKDNTSSTWLPVANDLITLGEARAKGNTIPYFNISFPAAVEGAEITYTEPRVIKGRDFSFKVVPTSPEDVVTVKANGFILTPNGNAYNLSNVTADQTITVIVQNAADVVSKRTLWVQAGKLSQLINDTEAGTVTDLTLYGTIDATDFTFMRDRMKLSRLDISGVSIKANGANPANAIPANAFSKCGNLRQIVLPKNINTFKSGCFSYSGLTSIEIPASVATYEYNIFLGCESLREVTVRRSAVAWVNWCVFQGTPKSKLIVPVGAAAAYRNKDYWKDFKEIEEQNPVADSQYTVTIQDAAGIKFTAMTESTEVAPGSQYEFKVDTDDSFGDATVELYANNTRLYPGENGLYKATINSNTLIHANFRQPEATWPDSPWKITGAAGGVGLVTDVVNVVPGKSFTIRANALGIPSENADQFYCVALTDKDGGVKEIISPVIYNSIYNYGNQPCNFVCQVKDATVREGNLIRVVSSLDKKKWSLVNAANDTIADRISAIGNRVVYYNINMPQKVEGASIQGGATQVVRGMPFSLKVTPVSVDDRVTVSVNGINKVVDAAIANISIPAVVEDLEINIQVNPKGSNAYTVVNVKEGELDAKIAQCPARLKVIGVMRSEDFDAFRKHAATIVDLDLADVTIKGAGDLANAIPSKAFASTGFVQTALKTIILPTNLVNIEENAFYRCVNLTEITLPSTVAYVGSGAFSTCSNLSKIVSQSTMPPSTGNMTPFPERVVALEVPEGAESYYENAAYWNSLNIAASESFYNIQIDPERSFNYNEYFTLTKIPKQKTTVNVGLPNCTLKPNPILRPNVAFRVYDNNIEVTYYDYVGTSYSSVKYGQHGVVFDPSYAPTSKKYPHDHEIKVVFHYPLNFKLPEGIKAEFVDVNEDNIWREVQMDLFVTGSTARPTLYKEGVDYKFRLVSDAANLEPKVKAISKIMTKVGANPEYKTVETVLLPDENGVYVISDLQGDTDIEVSASLVVEEGSQLSSGELGLVSEEEAKNITNIGVSGELDNAAFTEIRDKFKSLETLNLSELTNEEIPANAFLDMSSLKSVVIPENVVTIGSGAFAGCENLESVTLPGVEAIGDGAFDGCSNLTSITMLGKSADNAAEAVSRAPRKARLTEDAFRGINPNCLIYIPEDSGIELGTMRNVIVNQGSSRVADTDIVLEQGYPFNAPASFSLGANSISMTIDIPGSISDDNDGWKGVILPFAPDSVAYGEEFVPRGEKVLNLLTLNSEEGDTFTSADSIVANRPYLANLHAPFATVPVTFIARGKSADSEIVYDVNYTPLAEEMSVNGRGLTLYGAYGADNDKSDVYVLDENGVAFRRAATDSVAVTPFSVFVCPSETQLPDSVAVGSHPLWVFNPAPANDNGFKLYRSGSVELLSETAGSTIYYTVDGSDPASSETRIAYDAPFSLESDTLSINAVAEYKGYLSDAVNMVYELRKTNVNYSLEDGWNWISHNVENEIPVESIISDNVNRVVSQTEEAIRDPQFGVVGNLNSLNPLEAYKVFTEGGNSDQVVSGVSFDPSVPVALNKGWNWIGCPMENSCITVADAFVNLEAEEGDMIVGREGFAQADTDGNWVGDLQQLVLGQGYMYLSGSVKEFNYNAVPSHSEVRKNIVRENTKATWTIESSKYPSVMPITSHIVKDGGIMAADGEFEIGAFCGDECRGIGVCVEGWTMISVFGNPGDEISFRILSTDSHSEHALPQTLTFTESPVGSLKSPLVFNASSTSAIETVDNGAVKVIVENGNIEISGDTQSVELVEVYDIAGVKEASATNADKLKFENLKTGVHIVVIYTADGHISRKVEVK